MLLSVGVPKVFWTKSTTIVAYLINKCLSVALVMKTPEEIWLRHSSNLDNMRIFHYVAYAHIRQGKLDAHVVKYMFLWYLECSKGYYLWRLDS